MVLVFSRPSFDEYLASLSKSARKNWRNTNAKYGHLAYKLVEFDRARVEEFMQLWQRQLVRGAPIEWAFGVGHVEDIALRGELLVFDAGIGMHFIQKRNGFWECHPPMYDKKNVGLGTWMWFKLMEYSCAANLGALDLGGGPNNWKEHIENRRRYPNPRYKWRFVPEEVKRGITDNYVIEGDYSERTLRKIG